MPQIDWDSEAVKDLLELARSNVRQAARIQAAVSQFSRTGIGDVRALVGREDELRLRVGDWRVILRRESEAGRMLVLGVRRRPDAYQ